MQKIALLILVSAFPFFLSAQKTTSTVKGTVYDTVSHKGLAFATVSIVNAKDSTLINFSRADSTGKFQLRQVPKGKYLLSTSYVGFVPLWKELTVREGEDVTLGNVIMTDLKSMNSVTVVSKRPPVVMNNDTLEFNTENFRTQPNAVVEELLKKLPGVTVDADGTVKVNGETVNRVLVNGKEFFTGDPKLATKNLNADAVDKVQVFDKKSDRAEFTGVDDGNSQKAINLQLKKDRNHALFGRVVAGAGSNERFDAQTNINKFNGDQQISFLGMANNTNKQGFSISDVLNFTGELSKGMRNGGGITIRTGSSDNGGLPVTGLGQNQQGVATTYAGGANFNDTWNNKKTDVNGSAVMSDIHLLTDRSTNRQYLYPGNNYNYISSSSGVRDIKQQRFNMSFDSKIDSFTSFKIVPAIAFQQQNSISNSSSSSATNITNAKLNSGFNNSTTNADGYTFTNDMLFRRRLKKKGRTISADLNMNYNNSNQTGTLNTKTTYYPGGLPADSIVNQTNSNKANTLNIGGNVVYTEPLGKRSLLEFSAFASSTVGESDKKSFDYNNTSGKHDLANQLLTNNFKNTYFYSGGSINLRSNQRMFNYTLGASLQASSLESINQTYSTSLKQSFTDVLPNANLQYKFNTYRNLRFDYRSSTQQPSTSQLQPIRNISDPLNVVTGNPDLKRTFSHNFSLNYTAVDPVTQRNFFAFFNASVNMNAIVTADSVYSNGSRLSKPVNVNGTSSVFGNLSYGFPIRSLRSRFDLSLGMNYNHNISFLNGAENVIDNLGINPSFNWNFSIDNAIDISANAGLRISQAKYSLQPILNNNYMTQVYGMDMTNYLPWGIVLNNNFNYTINTGRADGYNTQIPFWNASVAKSFLKNKRAEVKVSAFDLLDRNIGSSHNVNQNYIEDLRYNVLQRYFLVSFTFALNKAGKQAGGPNIVVRTMRD